MRAAKLRSRLSLTRSSVKMGVDVTAVATDITTEAGRRAVLTAAPQPNILSNNAGGPPPGDSRKVERDA
jgi:3-oxoacyl-[acyl-carrier protein] reductase